MPVKEFLHLKIYGKTSRTTWQNNMPLHDRKE